MRSLLSFAQEVANVLTEEGYTVFVQDHDIGHGADFIAAPHLAQHPEFAWEKPHLHDMKSGPWTTFKSGQRTAQ